MPARARSFIILAISLPLLVGTVLVFRTYQLEIDHWITQIGWFGPLAIIGLYTLLSLTPIPTDPITLFVGALYGPLYGLYISSIGNTCASIAEYFVSHHIGSVARFDVLKKKLPWGLDKAPVDSIWFLTLGRLVPAYGGKLVSILGGLYAVPFKKYLVTSIIMNVIGSILWVIFGHLITRF